jgi:hypothetical protein
MELVYETEKTLETGTMHLKLFGDGYIEVMIKHGAVYDIADMIQGKDFITSYTKQSKAFILFELEGDVYTTREARELAASPEHSKHYGAIAVWSDKLAPKLLVNIYVQINKPKIPTRFFNKREEAIQWLKGFM